EPSFRGFATSRLYPRVARAHQERSPVPLMKTRKSGSFELQVQDLLLRITAPEEYAEECRAAALSAWEQLHAYSLRHPEFRSSKTPVEVPETAPAIVREMAAAATAANGGPACTTQRA